MHFLEFIAHSAACLLLNQYRSPLPRRLVKATVADFAKGTEIVRSGACATLSFGGNTRNGQRQADPPRRPRDEEKRTAH